MLKAHVENLLLGSFDVCELKQALAPNDENFLNVCRYRILKGSYSNAEM